MKRLFYYDKEKVTYEKVQLKTYLKYIGVLILVFGIGWFSSIDTIINKNIINKRHLDTLIFHTTPFNEEALIILLKECNIKYPHIVLAQAKLESNNFKSDIFKYNNNLVGLKKARQRLTTAISERKGHAFYEDWKSCVYDIGIWQMAFTRDVTTEEGYYQRLQERYAEDPQYASKLKNIVDKKHLKRLFEN